MNLRVEQSGKWSRFYGFLVDPATVKEYCLRCREESRKIGRPSSRAMNCWKIVARFDPDRREDVWKWLENAAETYPWLTGELTDGILILFFQKGRSEMWRFREYMIGEWCKRGLLPYRGSYFIPYRRGGVYYDSEYGPWRTWKVEYYDLTGELKRKAESINAICPYDGAIMEKHGNKLQCPLCSFKIPLNVLYEVLEFGQAEYELKSGPYKNKIYRIKAIDKDRVEALEYSPCSNSS